MTSRSSSVGGAFQAPHPGLEAGNAQPGAPADAGRPGLVPASRPGRHGRTESGDQLLGDGSTLAPNLRAAQRAAQGLAPRAARLPATASAGGPSSSGALALRPAAGPPAAGPAAAPEAAQRAALPPVMQLRLAPDGSQSAWSAPLGEPTVLQEAAVPLLADLIEQCGSARARIDEDGVYRYDASHPQTLQPLLVGVKLHPNRSVAGIAVLDATRQIGTFLFHPDPGLPPVMDFARSPDGGDVAWSARVGPLKQRPAPDLLRWMSALMAQSGTLNGSFRQGMYVYQAEPPQNDSRRVAVAVRFHENRSVEAVAVLRAEQALGALHFEPVPGQERGRGRAAGNEPAEIINRQAVERARAALQAGDAKFTAGQLAQFEGFVQYLNAQTPPVSMERFGPAGSWTHQEQSKFFVGLSRYWRISVGAVLGIEFETDAALLALRLRVNYEAARRANIIRPAPEVSLRNRFKAFVGYLDAQQPLLSIERFGARGHWTHQQQSRYLHGLDVDGSGADETRKTWRPAVNHVLALNLEIKEPVLNLVLKDNYDAVQRARAMRLSNECPDLTGNHVTDFIAFIQTIDNHAPPMSIKEFGPDGIRSIRDQERFLLGVRGGKYRVGVGAVLSVVYEADPVVIDMNIDANYEAVVEIRARQRERAMTNDQVSAATTFIKRLDTKDPPLSIEMFGPEGTKPLEEQAAYFSLDDADHRVAMRLRRGVESFFGFKYRDYPAAAAAGPSGAAPAGEFEAEAALLALREPANYDKLRWLRKEMDEGRLAVPRHQAERFEAFVRRLDKQEPPQSIAQFGPHGTWSHQQQSEYFLNNRLRNSIVWRIATADVLGGSFETRERVIALRPENYEAVRAAGGGGARKDFVDLVVRMNEHGMVMRPDTPDVRWTEPRWAQFFGTLGVEDPVEQGRYRAAVGEVRERSAALPAPGGS